MWRSEAVPTLEHFNLRAWRPFLSKTSTGGGLFKSLEYQEALRPSFEKRAGCQEVGPSNTNASCGGSRGAQSAWGIPDVVDSNSGRRAGQYLHEEGGGFKCRTITSLAQGGVLVTPGG